MKLEFKLKRYSVSDVYERKCVNINTNSDETGMNFPSWKCDLGLETAFPKWNWGNFKPYV